VSIGERYIGTPCRLHVQVQVQVVRFQVVPCGSMLMSVSWVFFGAIGHATLECCRGYKSLVSALQCHSVVQSLYVLSPSWSWRLLCHRLVTFTSTG